MNAFSLHCLLPGLALALAAGSAPAQERPAVPESYGASTGRQVFDNIPGVPLLGLLGIGANPDYHHASTASEGFLRGTADVLDAQGRRALLHAEAAVRAEIARRLYMENNLRWPEIYFTRREINRLARYPRLREQAWQSLQARVATETAKSQQVHQPPHLEQKTPDGQSEGKTVPTFRRPIDLDWTAENVELESPKGQLEGATPLSASETSSSVTSAPREVSLGNETILFEIRCYAGNVCDAVRTASQPRQYPEPLREATALLNSKVVQGGLTLAEYVAAKRVVESLADVELEQ